MLLTPPLLWQLCNTLLANSGWHLVLPDRTWTIAFPHVQKLGRLIKDFNQNPLCKVRDQFNVMCHLDERAVTMGHGWGGHVLIPLDADKPCTIVSYGLSHDVSFEIELSNRYDCSGVAMDPTVGFDGVASKALRKTSIQFIRKGAPTLADGALGPFPVWEEISVPKAISLVSQHTSLSVLKMDCEGCEYAIHRDSEGKNIFIDVDQFAVEFHLDRRFMQSVKHLEAFEKLLDMLEDAGLKLASFHFTGCGEDTKSSLGARGFTKNDIDAPKLLHNPCLKELEHALGHSCRLTCGNFLYSRL